MSSSVQTLRCLLVEDMEDDAKLVLRALRAGGYDVTWDRVETAETMRAALADKTWDIVLSDYQMPHFSGLRALELLRTTGQDLPFIIVSGTIGETVAVDCMKAGAHDYLMKDSLARLVPAVQRELREAYDRRQRRAAEESLRTNERRFRSFFDSSNVGMSLTQLSGSVHVNRAMCEMLGYSESELADRTWQTLSHPDDIAPTQRAIEDLIAGKCANVRMTKRYLHKSGAVIWGDLSSTLLRDSAGQPQCLLTAVVDITERRLAEQRIQEERDKLATLLDNIPDEVWFSDANRHFSLINHAGLNEFKLADGTSVSVEALASSLEVFRGDGTVRPVEEAPPLRALAGETVRNLEEIIRVPRTGELHYRQVNSSPVRDQAGKILGSISVVRDISDRKTAERKLAESEKLFRTIFEKAGVGVALVTLKGAFRDVNERFCQIVGYTREEVLATTFQQITYAADLGPDEALVQKCIAGEIPGFAVEKRYVRKDGSFVWAYLTVAIVRSADNQPLHFISVIEDLTERKQAELALRTSEQRFKRFMDQIPGLAYIKDAHARTVFANKGFADLLGLRVDEIVGKQSADIFPADFAAKVDAEDQEVLASGTTKELEEEYGDRVWMTRKFSIPLEGSEALLGGITLDVTERRKAEKALAAREEIFSSIIGQAKDAIALVDAATGRFVEFNRAAHEDLGYTREEFAGFQISDIQAHHDQGQIRDHIRQVLTEGGHSFESLHRHRSGEIRNVRISVRPMKLHGHDYLTAVWGDITEAKRMEGALRQTERTQRQLAEALSRAQAVGGIGSWETDLTTLTVTWSEQTHRIFGTNPATFTPTHQAFLDFVHPDDRAAVNAAFTTSLNVGTSQTIEHRIVLRDGQIKHVEERWQIFEDKVHGSKQAVGTCLDITTRKEAEAKLNESTEELRARNVTLARFNEAAVGRELRMIELKREINELCGKLREAPRYSVKAIPVPAAPEKETSR